MLGITQVLQRILQRGGVCGQNIAGGGQARLFPLRREYEYRAAAYSVGYTG
jgi:hypothetical protein